MEFEAVWRDDEGTVEAINVTTIEESNFYSEVRPDDEHLQRLANLTEIIGILEMIDGIIEDMIHGSEPYSEDSLDKECLQSRLAGVLDLVDVLKGIFTTIPGRGYGTTSTPREGRFTSGNKSDAVASSNVINLVTATKSRENEPNLLGDFGDFCIGKSLSSEEAVSKQVKDTHKNDKVIDVC